MSKRKIFKVPKNNTVYIIVYIVAFALLGLSAIFNNNQPDQEPINEEVALDQIDLTQSFLVVEVVDGDTLKLDKVGTVRLIGADTPETKDPRKEVECFGQEASDHLAKLVDQKEVKIELDSTQDILDKYDRVLAYVFLDEKNINKEIIESGFAYEYTYDTEYKYQNEFKAAQTAAQEKQAGLWSPETCNGER